MKEDGYFNCYTDLMNKKKENLNITFTFQKDISEELEESLWFQLFEILEI